MASDEARSGGQGPALCRHATRKDQEVRSVYGNFWDGQTAITGASRGVGIAELLDHCYAPSPFAQLAERPAGPTTTRTPRPTTSITVDAT